MHLRDEKDETRISQETNVRATLPSGAHNSNHSLRVVEAVHSVLPSLLRVSFRVLKSVGHKKQL